MKAKYDTINCAKCCLILLFNWSFKSIKNLSNAVINPAEPMDLK